MAASQTGLSETAKTDKSEDVEGVETRKDQNTDTQSNETKEHSSEATPIENPQHGSQNTSLLEKGETSDGKKASESKEGTPMEIDVESKPQSEDHNSKPNTDNGGGEGNVVDGNTGKEMEGACDTVKQAANPETKSEHGLEVSKDNSEEVGMGMEIDSELDKNTESKLCEEMMRDVCKIPDDKHSDNEADKGENASVVEIVESGTEENKKTNTEKGFGNTPGKEGENVAINKDEGASEMEIVVGGENIASKKAAEADSGENAVEPEGKAMEITQDMGRDIAMGVTAHKDDVNIQEDSSPSTSVSLVTTEQSKDGKNEESKIEVDKHLKDGKDEESKTEVDKHLKDGKDEESKTEVDKHLKDGKDEESKTEVDKQSEDGKNGESKTEVNKQSEDGKNGESKTEIDKHSKDGKNEESKTGGEHSKDGNNEGSKTEQSEDGKQKDVKEPVTEAEEPSKAQVQNGVSLRGKGRRKGNPKRAVTDVAPAPSTSTMTTRSMRSQQVKVEMVQPPLKRRKLLGGRSRPSRRSLRRRFHGWGAKRKTIEARLQ